MPLTCNWGDTPAYKMLKPIWDSIDTPDVTTTVWETPEWEQQPPIVQLLDNIMHGESFMGPPFASVLMLTGIGKVTEDNVAEMYGRMRTFEVFVGRPCLNNVGTYDENTGVYTAPDKPNKGTHLSAWMLSMFIGYSANWGHKTLNEWVKWMRTQPEGGIYTAKHVRDTVEVHKAVYLLWDSERNDPTQNDIDAFLNA